MANLFIAPPLTGGRIALAFAVAVMADGVAIALGPLGWAFFDEIIDVFAMIATTLLLGFHPLLLPTFLVEFIPGIDMFPTWTACVLALVALRKRQQSQAPPRPAQDPSSKVIDI